MKKWGYICRRCGEVKPLEAYEHWESGEGETKTLVRITFCKLCQKKRDEEAKRNEL